MKQLIGVNLSSEIFAKEEYPKSEVTFANLGNIWKGWEKFQTFYVSQRKRPAIHLIYWKVPILKGFLSVLGLMLSL